MAILYDAELRPSKLDLIAAWLPDSGWYRGDRNPHLERVASYRFDDPEGEVGIETHLVRGRDGVVLQVPLTYRGAPLEGGESALAGIMEHSVLGRRWVYDAVGDPVYTSVVASVIRAGGTEAEQFVHSDTGVTPVASTAQVIGKGEPDSVGTARAVHVVRRPLGDASVPQGPRLEGRWEGIPEPVTLVVLSDPTTMSA